MTPNARSREALEAAGWLVDTVERRITRIVTRDLFGIIDLLAVRDEVTLAVQVTTASNVAARRKKLQASDALSRVLAAGWRIELHGWVKRKGRWLCRVEPLNVDESAKRDPDLSVRGKFSAVTET